MSNTSLAYKFNTANIAIKLIVINAFVYIVFNLLPWLARVDASILNRYFVLPTDHIKFIQQPWSILSYSFLHIDVWHLLWNMVYLYVFSRFILNLFSAKRFLAIYLLGAMAGGLAMFLAYNLLPVFEGYANLRGASAAVMAIIVFIGTYAPNTPIRIFVFNLKLWHIAAGIFVINLFSLPSSDNAGGLVSHLGGATFGFIYARQLLKGNDIGLWFEKIMDIVAGWFSKKQKSQKKSPLRTVHKTKTTQQKKRTGTKSDHQQQVDAILDKISKSGYESLSKKEKDFLFKAGKE